MRLTEAGSIDGQRARRSRHAGGFSIPRISSLHRDAVHTPDTAHRDASSVGAPLSPMSVVIHRLHFGVPPSELNCRFPGWITERERHRKHMVPGDR
jgi:hypothetical protein